MERRGAVVLLLIIGLATVPACSPGTPTLRGVVTVDGELPPEDLRATISFEPVVPGTATAFASIDEEGNYEAMTGAKPGLAAGEYRVRISTPIGIVVPGMPAEKVPMWAPLSYNDYETSGLSVTVKPGSNTHNFELKSDHQPAAGG